MNRGEAVTSEDGKLEVTLVAFNPKQQKGQIEIKELSHDRGRYYVTVKFSGGDGKGQTRIDYKTWDVHKTSTYPVTTSVPNDSVSSIEISFAGAQ